MPNDKRTMCDYDEAKRVEQPDVVSTVEAGAVGIDAGGAVCGDADLYVTCTYIYVRHIVLGASVRCERLLVQNIWEAFRRVVSFSDVPSTYSYFSRSHVFASIFCTCKVKLRVSRDETETFRRPIY